jgi:hypothetical protein
LVAILLVITIGYCTLLNKRLRRLKADEQALKATISELITATEIAERAIAGLKITVRDCDQSLGARLRNAEYFSAELGRQLSLGTEILDRLTKIVMAARPGQPSISASDPNATVLAAEAFAARNRMRARGVAA